MNNFRSIWVVAAIVFFLAAFISCHDKSTQPDGGVGQSDILSSLLSVSIIPGGTETIIITARDRNGLPDTFTAECDNEEVATVMQADTTVEVTGVGYGEATLTITGGSGCVKEIPVLVYNHHVLDVGELEISFVDTYTLIATAGHLAFYQPETPEGFHALGSLGTDGSDANGNFAMMVVRAKDGSDALAEPVEYDLEFYLLRGMGPPFYYQSTWTPIPPEGYVSLGCVVNLTFADPEPPPLNQVVCVREDLTMDAESGDAIWSDPDYGGCWRIDQPDAGPHEYCYLTCGTFVGWEHDYPPTYHPVLHVLNAVLPMLAEAPYETYVPQLTSFEEPPLFSPPVMAKAMLVPCTIVNDLQYSDNLQWRIANSPLYRLERQVFYKRLYHNHNTSSQPQENSVTIISGVTTTESQTFYDETSVSVSFETGISIKAFTGKISATVSRRFGYSTQTSVAELEQKEVQTSINTAPGTAAACWQKYNRYVLFRHSGVDYEPVFDWYFGIDSYVVDDYPD